MPSIVNSAIIAALAGAASVSAHGYVTGVRVNGGAFHQGYDITTFYYQSNPPDVIGWSTSATDLGFVSPSAYNTPNIICHRDAKNAKLTLDVNAGDTLTLTWNTWPDSHQGPIIDMLASCGAGGCATVDKTTLEFFKIAEKGLISSSPARWAADQLMADNLNWDVKIPTTLRPGNYVLRHEIIALHGGANPDGAQSYPQCINIRVSGSGNVLPAGVKGTSLYTPTDPGILFNIYQNPTSYPIPGPALPNFGGNGPNPPTTTSPPPPTRTTVAPTSTRTAAPTTTAAPPDDCIKRRAARRAARRARRALRNKKRAVA